MEIRCENGDQVKHAEWLAARRQRTPAMRRMVGDVFLVSVVDTNHANPGRADHVNTPEPTM